MTMRLMDNVSTSTGHTSAALDKESLRIKAHIILNNKNHLDYTLVQITAINPFKKSLNDNSLTEIILSGKGSLQEAASKLYTSLHELDSLNLDVIIAERFPEFGLGKSINDRLQRATFS